MGNIINPIVVGKPIITDGHVISNSNFQITILPKVLLQDNNFSIPMALNSSRLNITENVDISNIPDNIIKDNKNYFVTVNGEKDLIQNDIDFNNNEPVKKLSFRERKKLLGEDNEKAFRYLLSEYSKTEQDKIVAALNEFCPSETDCGDIGKKTTVLNMLVSINNENVSIPADILVKYFELMSGVKLKSHKIVIEDMKTSMDEDIESTRKNLSGVLGDIEKGYYELEYNKSLVKKRKIPLADFVKNLGPNGVAKNFFEGKVLKNTEFTDINKQYENGDTTVMYVLKNLGEATFRNLLKNFPEIDLNIPNDFKHTPIIEISCLANKLNIFKFLVKNPNVDINVIYENGDNLLNRLLKNYMFDRLINLLEREDLDINWQDVNGNSAFMNLCIYKNSPSENAALKFINDKRLNLNLVNNKNRTALMELLVPYTFSAMNTGYWVGVQHKDGNSDLKEAKNIYNVTGKKWYFPRKAILTEILKNPDLDLSIKDVNGDDIFDLAKKYSPEVLPLLEEYKRNHESRKK